MDRNELLRQLMETFKLELDEHVATLNNGLLAMEEGLPPEEGDKVLKELFRAAHSVKGSARAVEMRDIELVSHKMEDVFEALKQGELSLSSGLVDGLLRATDILSETMTLHLQGKTIPRGTRDALMARLDQSLTSPMPDTADTSADTGAFARKEEDGIQPPRVTPIPDGDASTVPGLSPPARDRIASATESPVFPTREQQMVPDRSGEVDTPEDPECAAKSNCLFIQPVGRDTIRVATEKLDELMAFMGQLQVSRMRMEQRLGEVKAVQEQFGAWEKAWRKVKHHKRTVLRRDNDNDLETLMGFCERNERYLKEMRREVDGIAARVENDYRDMTLLTDDMQNGIRQIRMVPVSTLFDLFPRMIRDIGKEKKKFVQLRLEGMKTEMDRQVLEGLKDPLIHLLRNAVDHGIESPHVRRQKNKPEQGTITLKAFQQGNQVVIEVSDDGAGIHLAGVRKAAIENHLMAPADVKTLSLQETVDLIFHSGLSTHKTVTELSGRGVGMDVVREQLEKLHGQVKTTTETDRGTTFHLILPLTLATSHVLMLSVAGETLAIPTTSVERILSIDPTGIGSMEGRPAITINNQALPLISMAQVLELHHAEDGMKGEDKLSVVVLGAVEKRMAFQVDNFLGDQDVVVKSLGPQLSGVRHIAGATLLGTGQVVMILNAGSMMQWAKGSSKPSYPVRAQLKKPDAKKILVVDDSITTRLLEKNILENHGYQVRQAADGMQGWELLQEETFDAVVFDIEMPRMNGLQLTEKVRQEGRFENMPIILVTSLGASMDKIRGMEAGADAYITKGAFDQKELLETIERLIG
ncbi:hybrid sensor histidine kinase/response regulator [Desulfocicer niacini]